MAYNLNVTHPLIENKQQYITYIKTLSIHSEDRDMLKYPLSSEFELILPQDYLNVRSVKVSSWTFPYNMNRFTQYKNNITMTFKINNPYNPGDFDLPDYLQNAIFAGLHQYYTHDKHFEVIIQSGNYIPEQMVNEVQNKMNYVVTKYLSEYLKTNYPLLVNEFIAGGGYKKFVLVFDIVGYKIWYGNTSDGFILTNENVNVSELLDSNCSVYKKNSIPDFTIYGLPRYLGFSRCNADSIKVTNPDDIRFYYDGNIKVAGDNGYWLFPDPALIGSSCYFIEPPMKLFLEQPYSFYIDIQLLNCLDEIAPFNVSTYTLHTNQNNGIVNSAIAKVSPQNYSDNNISCYLNSNPYKYFDPPAERIRKLCIKIRYHNGTLVNFNDYPYTFTLDFELMVPSIKEYKN